MAKNPFTSVSDVTRKVGKNYYDWSHDYNFTGKIGTIYPVFAKYCPAGQSLSIDAVAGLQFMPMQFPVQSKMKMKLSFWRMPLRAMWKDYTNLVSSQNQPDVQKDYVAPYIDFNHPGAYTDMLSVGGLCDYLRVPVTLQSNAFSFDFNVEDSINQPVSEEVLFSTLKVGQEVFYTPSNVTDGAACGSGLKSLYVFFNLSNLSGRIFPSVVSSSLRVNVTYRFTSDLDSTNFFNCLGVSTANSGLALLSTRVAGGESGKSSVKAKFVIDKFSRQGFDVIVSYKFADGVLDYNVADNYYISQFFEGVGSYWTSRSGTSILSLPRWRSCSFSVTVPSVQALTPETSPYFDSSNDLSVSDKQLKLSAYPFRMYEAIYNSYIRYIRNNPFKKNGKAVYNEWLPTMDGGADKTPYKLHRCNWSADAYTTAVQSPQQGVAPVVGLSQATLTGEDGVSRVVPAITTEDGRAYGIEFKANEFGLEGVDYTELGTGAKVAPVHSMYGLAQSGISIEDFRMTNAYQRYLELNMMRGYSYKQIVEGRFEVNVKYDDLLMPEFCGGMTRDVFMSGVQQNVEDNGGSGTYIGSLGSEAGVAGCRGDLGHKVKIYCDEASYVMCLAYVVPQSIYSQICPKDFLYRDLLDAWSPEFDQIGFQPIKHSELCPVEAWNSVGGHDSISDTFGFQRPWHEYCEVPDASVGLFNSELRNFLMHRVFDSLPSLGSKFTLVNNESVDHVFSVTEFTDKFFGQIHFSIDVKSPVSRVVIPSLE